MTHLQLLLMLRISVPHLILHKNNYATVPYFLKN